MTYPAIDWDGTRYWRDRRGKLHRARGPAVEWPDGYKEWRWHGQVQRRDFVTYRAWYNRKGLHRARGPAVEWPGGYKEWFKDGKREAPR